MNGDCPSGKSKLSKNGAEKNAEHIMRVRNVRLRVYLCAMCHYYHLTSSMDDSYRAKGR